MDRAQKSKVKTKILSLIEEADSAIKDMEGMTMPITPENAIGRISRMDAIQNKSVMEATLRKRKEKRSKLQIALQNLNKDNFGICTRCGNHIQIGRLIYMPESTYCIQCADKR